MFDPPSPLLLKKKLKNAILAGGGFPYFLSLSAQAGTHIIGDGAVIGTLQNVPALATRAPLVHRGTPLMQTARSVSFSGQLGY